MNAFLNRCRERSPLGRAMRTALINLFFALLSIVVLAIMLGACTANAQGMQLAGVQGEPVGAVISNGATTVIRGSWQNTTGQTIYIWGLNPQISFGGTVLPGESAAAGGNVLGVVPGVNQYLQNVADLSLYLIRGSDNMVLLEKASDHYANDPELLWASPVFFPVPFYLRAGDSIKLECFGTNGYQAWVGGSIVFSATAQIYYTVGSTFSLAIQNF
jgi:hypothetical protein